MGAKSTLLYLCPAVFVVFPARGPAFSVAYRLEPLGFDAEGDKLLLRRFRPPLAQSKVILPRCPRVAVSHDHHLLPRVLPEPLEVLSQGFCSVEPDLRFVETEIDGLQGCLGSFSLRRRPVGPGRSVGGRGVGGVCIRVCPGRVVIAVAVAADARRFIVAGYSGGCNSLMNNSRCPSRSECSRRTKLYGT